MFENTSQHNERWQERNQVFKNTSQHNEQRQELQGPLIWHASMQMENMYFIRHADYGMHLAFMVVGTFTYFPQHLVQEKNVAPMAACHLPVGTLRRN